MMEFTFNEMIKSEVQKLYSIEIQLEDGLKMLTRMAQRQDLKEALDSHRQQTAEHAKRIELICSQMGWQATGLASQTVKAMQREVLEELNGANPGPVVDAVIIGAAQQSEHLEIAAYGTAIALARQMGQHEAADLLQQTLEEEKQANERLSQIAQTGVNEQAVASAASLH